MILFASVLAVLAPHGASLQESRPPLASGVDAAVARGGAWLVSHQALGGSFGAGEASPIPALALTALALWSLSESATGSAIDAACDRAAEALLRAQQPDGGIYDPARGLSNLTSAVSLRELTAWDARRGAKERSADMGRLESFVLGHSRAESLEDLGTQGQRLDTSALERSFDRQADLPDHLAGAVGFLRRVGERADTIAPTDVAPDELSYAELLSALTYDGSSDVEWLGRAHRAIQARYDLARNPGLARPELFSQPARAQDGLYYSYLVLARTLRSLGEEQVRDAQGVQHGWREELGKRLIALQEADGSWINRSPRWGEGNRVLVTSYALLSLDACRGAKETR
jgi:hypothetical protein